MLKGALRDAADLLDAINLMTSREHLYDLHYDLIITFYEAAVVDYRAQECKCLYRRAKIDAYWSGDFLD